MLNESIVVFIPLEKEVPQCSGVFCKGGVTDPVLLDDLLEVRVG